MAGQKFNLTFDATLNVSQMKGALGQIQSALNGLHLPQNVTKGLQGTFDKLQKEIQEFEVAVSKDITGKADFNKIVTQANKISDAFEKLKIQVKDLSGLSGKDLERLFPTQVSQNIKDATNAIKKYSDALDSAKNSVKSQNDAISNLNKQIAKVQNTPLWTDEKKQELTNTKNEIKSVQSEIEALQAKINEYNANRKGGPIKEENWRRSPTLKAYLDDIDNLKDKLGKLQDLQLQLERQKGVSITAGNQAKKLEELNQKLIEAQNALKQYIDAQTKLESAAQGGGLQQLIDTVGKLIGLDTSNFKGDVNDLANAINTYLNQQLQELSNNLQTTEGVVNGVDTAFNKNAQDVRDCADAYTQFNTQSREVDQLKSRIQYFFGLNNAIQLVKRTMREAYETIKELDKAMTETAVVTDFTVGDMWAQLPDYTKRANELGVTTKAAYEAATLYYQQGLNTNEVIAMSNETLKMARIAGLDAAVATDRMTNAIRGFNMEINEMNAQKIDDVYSRLAAISASNVDEISTAMTKVASLAHNANMEFETTAAFLAQIIETTRESAETAGTALKTVVARFSEVKKLVDENQLKGKDEEGELIDVNKVSEALRTAGIDLNKYFLGEVGLDDIFMELASKWNSLTTLQQRYIATQAAGSRQQSRFIALMSDYARTQELVGEAYNANGAAAKQFAKTQESLESKLARLKNAWNEFAMGILNDDLVKVGVDLLTNFLNGVNALTSGFGSLNEGIGGVINSLLKLGLLIGALNLGKGLASGLFAGLVGGQPLANMSGAMLGTASANAGFIGNLAGKGTLGTLAAGFLNPFAGAGKVISGGAAKAWGGMKALGNIWGGVSAGSTAAGLAGLATALSGVAIAAGAAFAIYQAWLRLTPEGQLKKAKKEAEEFSKVADEKQKELDTLNSLQDTYAEKTAEIEKTTTAEDRVAAVKERNQAVLDAIEEDSTLAKYVVTEVVDNEIVITIDEDALANAINNATKEAREAEVASQFGNARVDLAQAAVYQKQLNTLWAHTAGMSSRDAADFNLSPEEYFNRIINSKNASPDDQARAAELYQTITGLFASAQQTAEYAYAQQLKGLSNDNTLINSLLPVLGEAFKQTQKQLSEEELSKVLDLNKATLTPILEAFQGKGKITEISLEGIDFKGDELFEALGLSTAALENFADALGWNVDELKGSLKQQAKYNKELRRTQQSTIFEQALRSGRSVDTDLFKTVKELTPDQLNSISSILTQASDKISAEVMSGLVDQLPTLQTEQLQQLQDFFNDFSLDNPIQALDQLNNKIAQVGSNSAFGKLLTDIKQTNAELFKTSNLVQSFLISDSFENLSDSIEDLRKENNKLTAKNVEELADSCDDLQAILENTDVTAQGLAETLNLLGEGALSIDQITESLLAALSAGESFETLISNVQDWIENFDQGSDLTEGTEHITSVIEEALEYVSDWQFGNEPLRNIYDHIFGNGAYDDYMQASWGKKSFEQLEEELTAELTRISELADNEGLGALQALTGTLQGLTSNGEGTEFNWDLSGFESASKAINAVATGLGVTEDAARAFIEAWGSHMYDLREDWNNLNFNDTITAFNEALGQSNIVTEQEIQTLAEQTGKSATEIEEAINKVRTAAGEPIIVKVNWQNEDGSALNGEDLIEQVDKLIKTSRTRYNGAYLDTTEDYINFADQFKNTITSEIDGVQKEFDTIDFTALNNHLVEQLKLTPAQATEVANTIAKETGRQFSQEIEVPIKADDGSIKMEAETITSTTAEGLQAGIDAAIQAANVQLVADKLVALDVSEVGNNLGESIETGGKAGVEAVAQAIDSLPTEHEVTVIYNEVNRPAELGSSITVNRNRASGGIVQSRAKGSENFHVAPGTALTGEEGAEIVWNKNKGYAYITGKDGPEFQDLQPGDRVFNASETKRILKNSSATGSIVDSYASGGWKPDTEDTSGGAGGKSDKEKTPDEWKNELDWLYNLMEDITELERKQVELQEDYEDYLKDDSKTSHDLYELLIKQLGNLYTQLNHQQSALEFREREMREFMEQTNEFDNLLWYNWNDRTLEIDWDAIEGLEDKETYDKVKDLVSAAEDIQDKMDDAEDQIIDIKNQIQELENIWRETYTDFESRVMDAIIKQYQTVIDNYSELNDTLNNTNTEILNALQKQISLERQIRDNTQTEENIADSEAQLAFLRRDTTGGNELAALQLQQQLDDQRRDYEDNLIDQAISRLQDDNDAAAEQRERQIEIMQAQLDYQQQSGEFNEYVRELLESAMGAEGELLTNSDLVKLLKEQENWSAMSETSKQVWEEELNGTFKEVAAFILKQYAEENGTFTSALTGAIEGMTAAIGSKSQPSIKIDYGSGGGGGGSGGGGSGGSGGGSSGGMPVAKQTTTETFYLPTSATNAIIKAGTQSHIGSYNSSTTAWTRTKKYKTGGLANSTGFAWLDGTPEEPEYVLNARQTDAFLRLADVLPSMMQGSGQSTVTSFGGIELNLVMNVDQIASDYDVDRIADRVKDIVYNAGSYRNVNTLNFIR